MKGRIKYIMWAVMAVFMLIPSSASAQMLRLQVFGLNDKGQEEKAVNVRVYSFLDNAHAQRAQRTMQDQMSQEILREKTYRYSDTGLTDKEGVIDLKGVGTSGFLVIDAFEYCEDPMKETFALLIDVSKLNAHSADDIVYEAKYVIRSKKQDVKKLREIESKAKRIDPEFSGEGIVVDNGKDVTVSFKLKVDSVWARNDARFVASPFLICPAENNDTIGFFLPRALDGYEYDKTLMRRMGDDLNHDKMWPYVIKTGYMHERKDTVIGYSCILRNYDRTRKYNGLAHIWYEDYNAVYHHEIIRVWDGLLKNYNRFLDWSTAVPEVALDVEHYEKIGRPEASTKSRGYHLEFEVGKADLNMNDSMTVHELERLRTDIHNIFHSTTDDQMLADTIRGCASPEGGYASNLALARRRAESLVHVVNASAAGGTKRLDPSKRVVVPFVVPWSEVADTLEVMGDSLSRAVATDIRELVQAHNDNIDRINAAVTKYPWYRDYVLPSVLPRMRRVEYRYRSATFAVLTQDEIYTKYKNKDGNFYSGSELRDYVYYNLMNSLYENGDFTGLERIAKQALANVKEDVYRVDTICMYKDSIDGKMKYRLDSPTPVYSRPYALASYYLAQAKLQKGEYDCSILERDYMDFDRPKEAHEHSNERGVKLGWFNEPAMVLTQVLMKCGERDYNGASEVVKHHLNTDDPKFARLGYFIRALQSEYDDEDVRDTVALSSPMNFMVAWCAYCDMTEDKYEMRNGYKMILDLCNGDMTEIEKRYPGITDAWGEQTIDPKDFRVMYMKAIASYKSKCPEANQMKNAPLFLSNPIYNPDDEENCWAFPMLEAIQNNEANAEFFESDGTFNDSFRLLVLFFHQRLKQGATMDQIKTEYDALRNNYVKSETK